MAPSTSSDVAPTATTTSLGKRARSPPSRLTDMSNGNGSGDANGNGEGAESSDDDDGDLGPMPMPAGQDEGDANAAAGTSKAAAAAAVKRRKTLRHEKVYLENVPSADRYYRAPAAMAGYPSCCSVRLSMLQDFLLTLPRSLPLSRVSVHQARSCTETSSRTSQSQSKSGSLSLSFLLSLCSLLFELPLTHLSAEPTSSSRPLSTDTSKYGRRRIPTTQKGMLHQASG